MLVRINSLQINRQRRHTCLLKRMWWPQNSLRLAIFPKPIRLYAQYLKLHLGITLCTNYRKMHRSVQSISMNNSGLQKMHSTRYANKMNGSIFKKIPFLWRKLGNIFASASLWMLKMRMDGKGADTLDGSLQKLILIYRTYFARISCRLTFWGISSQTILMKSLVAGWLPSNRQTIYCAPSSSALHV